MIKFKNINGDVFLAVGSIKRKSALNGEKSLTGTLFEGDDVLNKIDKGWSLEFDNEPYVVTYFERNDNDNTVEFDAIHKFFWDMNKSVLYSSASGSHTAKWYLDQIFNGTGYTYALNFDPSAFEKENWGMKNKLSLFNDAISGMGGEFEVNGTLVSIFKNIGSDLSTIVRHGFNLSDMSLENDNTDFVTYGEGFGAYADQENQTGERLHVTYTSSLAKTFGKLHAEPIDDQRYTIKDNLLQAIKDKIDGSFAISIKLSLYDLTAAGYPYKMANVGDWLLAIDENLDFKQKIRIISVDDEFATDSTRISYTVTCGDIGIVQKYQQANASLGQKVDSAYQNAQDAKESSIQAVIAANGKNTNYYVDGIDNLPETANEGDVTFVQTGDGQAMYIYTKLPDGSFKWVKRLDPDTGEQIAAGVDEAVATANSQAAAMDKVQADNLNNFKSEHAEQLASAAAVAQNAANSAADEGRQAAADAKKYADSAASEALSDANIALTTAKQELGSEVSKAQSDIVNTQTELSGKVSQTDFDNKTGDLSTKYDKVKLTADKASADLVSYKEANDKIVSANTTNISATSKEVKTKVSQTDYDANKQQVGNQLAEFKQRADGFDATVKKVNNLTVGGRNYVLNSSGLKATNTAKPTLIGTTSDVGGAILSYTNDGVVITNNPTNTTKEWFYSVASAWTSFGNDIRNDGTPYTFSAEVKGTAKQVALRAAYNGTNPYSVINYANINENSWTKLSVNVSFPSNSTGLFFRIQGAINNQVFNGWTGGEYIKFRNVKIENGTISTDWTPAPEDTDNALAVQQTAITANADVIKLKASQTDLVAAKEEYNQKFANVDIQAGKITSSVTSVTDKINSLSVGGRNLLLKSDKNFVLNPTAHQFHFETVYTELIPGKTYTFSAEIESIGSTATGLAYIAIYNRPIAKFYTGSNLKADNTRQSFTFTVPKDIQDNATLIVYSGEPGKAANLKAIYHHMKLEEGNVSTDWTPAPEDTETLVESVRTQLAGSITQEVEDRKSGDKSVLSQTDGMISSQIADYNIGVVSNIAAMANGIYANVSSVGVRYIRLNGQGNNENAGTHFKRIVVTDKSGKNVLSGLKATAPYGGTLNNPSGGTDGDFLNDTTYIQIQGYEPNADKYIQYDLGSIRYDLSIISLKMWTETRTYYNVTVQVSADNNSWRTLFLDDIHCGANPFYDETIRFGAMGSQGIMSLTDSSFSTMLTNHSGNVITAINGDTSGVTITGKQLTLDGNTTVTGDFYAKGGNFKNLNASNITTGTINAAKINVINLDVSSLSGNITNFIKSYWNSAYSSVKIDSSGMVVSTDSSNMAISDTGFAVTTGRSVTELSNGKIDYTSDSAERIGYTGWLRLENTTVDYLSIILKGWHTTKKDDMFWTGGGKNFYGGDGIKFGITNANYSVTDLLVWNSQYASSQTNYPQGWTMLDDLQHFGNEEKYGNLNLHGHFDVPGSYQALQFRPIVYNGTTYPAMMGSDKGTSGGAILFGSEEIYLKHGNNVVSLADVARKAGYNI
ncbi:phage tail protein [Weissella paramesenteroides]|uniref:phage tail protein n=1 Tax=Weissella paramesenteroides TaxID=1249 RepID=UPI00223B9E31|nr:phage tail protein [Weissella paramesenteroides]MCT0484874.1 hypothetical protein [Weissella paramesenteroides]